MLEKIMQKITLMIENFRIKYLRYISVGQRLLFLSLLCFLVYTVSLLLDALNIVNLFMIADMALAVGAGLATGLAIYAVTNHRSKKERELLDIIELSQKVVNDYYTLHSSLSKYPLLLRFPDFKMDMNELSSTVENSLEMFMDDCQSLTEKDQKIVPELKKIEKFYFDKSFHQNITKKIDMITLADDEKASFFSLIKFEDEIDQLFKVILEVKIRAELDLQNLRESII